MVKLYVEGGGHAASLRTACRKGFSTFLERAGLKGRMPRIVACGSRQDAYDAYCTAVGNNEEAILLVDSEGPVAEEFERGEAAAWQPWGHLMQCGGDGWKKPPGVADADCHLMVQCMESWFLADRRAISAFFGQGYRENRLPPAANAIEAVGKERLYRSLADATRDCKSKAQYGKGEHSFKLLVLIDPRKVKDASPWAKRFVDEIEKRMGGA